MWEDKILYWIWSGLLPPHGKHTRPPTKKQVEYARVGSPYHCLNGQNKGSAMPAFVLAVGVWDDDKYTLMNRDESLGNIGWYKMHDFDVQMPEGDKNAVK